LEFPELDEKDFLAAYRYPTHHRSYSLGHAWKSIEFQRTMPKTSPVRGNVQTKRRHYLRDEPIHNTTKNLVEWINFLLWSWRIIDVCLLILSGTAIPLPQAFPIKHLVVQIIGAEEILQ
jgi:hypothetical protein